jgi:hypothetical protein
METKEILENEKKQRLLNLSVIKFRLQMDMAAYKANEDEEGAEKAQKQIDQVEKSYAAIEAMPID